MAKLKLRIGTTTTNGIKKTVTKMAKKKDLKSVIFHNVSASSLEVRFNKGDVLCDIDDKPLGEGPFNVPPKEKRKFRVCSGVVDGAELKYTAQITGFAAEDPIIIIEK